MKIIKVVAAVIKSLMIKDKQLFYLPSEDMGNLRIAGNSREENREGRNTTRGIKT